MHDPCQHGTMLVLATFVSSFCEAFKECTEFWMDKNQSVQFNMVRNSFSNFLGSALLATLIFAPFASCFVRPISGRTSSTTLKFSSSNLTMVWSVKVAEVNESQNSNPPLSTKSRLAVSKSYTSFAVGVLRFFSSAL